MEFAARIYTHKKLIHIHTYINIYIHICMHTYTHNYIHTDTHTYLNTYINTYIHTYTHTYIKCTPNLTTIITDHGNIRSYLHRFQLINSPTCACGNSEQTIDHILYSCKTINRERDSLISRVEKTNKWPDVRVGVVENN